MTHPPVLGGQGRSDRDVRASANTIALFCIIAAIALCLAALWGKP